jgi:hypothetical protein
MQNNEESESVKNFSSTRTFIMIMGAIGSLAITLMCWAAWLQTPIIKARLIGTLSIALCHLVCCHQIGYKSYYLDGFRVYFYTIWLVPSLLSLFGALLGLRFL